MTRRSKISGAAATAFVAAVALIAGLPAANADELSDLRANNQLLQQRLDQLAQVGPAKPALPPGTPSIAGSFPRSFLIPGTDTSIQIGGFVDLSAAYTIQGGGPSSNAAAPPGTGVAAAAGLPLNLKGTVAPFAAPTFDPHARQAGWFRMQASESRLFVETRTPTAWGQALTHLEFDMYGCTAGGVVCSDLNASTNPDVPRLRLAYGTLGGFIAGQNWVPGNDLAAAPEIFDFFGDAGTFAFARAPQIGYKWDASPWLGGASIGLYAVQPTGELGTPVGATHSDAAGVGAANVPGVNGDLAGLAFNPLKDPFPDGALVLDWQQPWGHFQLHGVIRDVEMQDGRFISKEYVGYGGGFSGNVHPNWFGWSKDNLGFQAFAGEGLGHWGTNWTGGATNSTMAVVSNYGGPGLYGSVGGPTGLTDAEKIMFTTVTSWGGE